MAKDEYKGKKRKDNKMRRSLLLVLALIMLLSIVSACNEATTPPAQTSGTSTSRSPSTSTTTTPGDNSPANETPSQVESVKYKEHITIIASSAPFAINRFLPGSGNFTLMEILLCVGDRLVDEKEGVGYIPMLATEWHTDDWKVFTFKLRNDVYFHNGEHFTADDVVFTFEHAKGLTGTDTFDRLGRFIEKAEAISDYEVKVTLNVVNVDFLDCVSWAYSTIANRKACEDDPENGHEIGTGPFMFDDYVLNEYVTISRNDNYWGEIPKSKKLTFLWVTEQTARMLMLENREVEVAWETNFGTDYPYIESDDRFIANKYIAHAPIYIGFNMTDRVCGDLNFRKAVVSAIDKEMLISISRNGYAVPPTNGSFWGYGTEFMNTSIPVFPYDTEKAKEYLAQSVYNGEEITITAALPNAVTDAQLLQEILGQIGIKIKVNQTDIAGINAVTMYSDNKCQILIHTGNWNNTANSVRSFYSPNASVNRTSYDNPQIVELLETVGTILDKAERERVYQEIQRLAAEDMPFTVLYYNEHMGGSLQGVEGLDLRANAAHRLAYVYMIEQ